MGRALSHIQLNIADDGEIVVQDNAYLGYVGQREIQMNEVRTGDIGYIDDAGFVYITGRKKNIFITSFGRNVSSEWVERELKISPAIAQAALFGEAKPWNVAVLVPRKHVNHEEIAQNIQAVNQTLPDYARVTKWLIADEPFTQQNQQLTANGRNRRDMIWQYYQERINALYEGN